MPSQDFEEGFSNVSTICSNQKIIALAYIYPLAKFGDFMSCSSKDIFKNALSIMY